MRIWNSKNKLGNNERTTTCERYASDLFGFTEGLELEVLMMNSLTKDRIRWNVWYSDRTQEGDSLKALRRAIL